MRRFLLASAVAAGALALAAGAASAYTVVAAGSAAEACYDASNDDIVTRNHIDQCNEALSVDPLPARDRASTLVNRGAIYFKLGNIDLAMQDFEAAIAADATLAEGHTNRGLILMRRGDFSGAVASISRGLELGPREPEYAYYNRAGAYEGLNNMRAAYQDYRMAASAAPSWAPARRELARFRVG